MGIAEELRLERQGRTIPLLRFYTDFKISNPNMCYGFVEGVDDPSYYRTIINNKLPKGCLIILYPSNGKENVKYIYEEISKRNYPKNRITYYIDRDLSSVIDDPNIINDSSVYITDKYSIENDILSEDTFSNVAQDILGFSSISLKELNTLKECYTNARVKYEEMMVPIMANIIHWKIIDCKPANYKNLKIKDVIIVKNGDVEFKSNQQEAIKILYKQSQVDFIYCHEEEINNIIMDITSKNLSSVILRGKYLASFFIEFCNSLYDNSNNMGIKRGKGRKISSNDIMQSVAPRSKPPESLLMFIKNNIISNYEGKERDMY